MSMSVQGQYRSIRFIAQAVPNTEREGFEGHFRLLTQPAVEGDNDWHRPDMEHLWVYEREALTRAVEGAYRAIDLLTGCGGQPDCPKLALHT